MFESDVPDMAATVEAIAGVQLDSGAIPWTPQRHADPWNHVEAAMALATTGLRIEAEAAYRWLARLQRADGAWWAAYVDDRVHDPSLDSNFCAYVATGVWHHWLLFGDLAFVEEMWPVVEAAIGFVLALQGPAGEISWARDYDYRPWPRALLTSSSSIHLSLRCAIGLAELIGSSQPEWELAVARLMTAITERPELFEDKQRFAMDWYYPVLGGAIAGDAARLRLAEGWDRFVVDGLGCRCVSDRPWVTAAETAELVLTLHVTGMEEEAAALFEWVHQLRADDGSYWTGATFPDGVLWPREAPTWCSGAVVLAADALSGLSATSRLFRGEGLPEEMDFSTPVGDLP